MSAANGTLHITPVEGGAWAVKPGEDFPAASVHPTEAQAIASVYELVAEPGLTEVIIHDTDRSIRSSLKILRYGPTSDRLDPRPLLDDPDDPAARSEAIRITPSNACLKAGIARGLPVEDAALDAESAEL
jgi:hypothetical protein